MLLRVADILKKYQEWVYTKTEGEDHPITPREVAFLLKELGSNYDKGEIERKYRKWVCGMVIPEDEFPITGGDVHYLLELYYGEDPLSPHLREGPHGHGPCTSSV